MRRAPDGPDVVARGRRPPVRLHHRIGRPRRDVFEDLDAGRRRRIAMIDRRHRRASAARAARRPRSTGRCACRRTARRWSPASACAAATASRPTACAATSPPAECATTTISRTDGGAAPERGHRTSSSSPRRAIDRAPRLPPEDDEVDAGRARAAAPPARPTPSRSRAGPARARTAARSPACSGGRRVRAPSTTAQVGHCLDTCVTQPASQRATTERDCAARIRTRRECRTRE